MLKSGMSQSIEDPCIFYKSVGQKFLYCGIHVDDMVIVSGDDDIEKCYMSRIGKRIDIKCLDDAKCILGMQVEQKSGRIYVHQKC